MTETKLRSIDTKNNENVATTDSEFIPVQFFLSCFALRKVSLISTFVIALSLFSYAYSFSNSSLSVVLRNRYCQFS